ncbi:hypothetical protein T484DRAFT_1917069 [Baffinella frigidus]|nr:hypothetical protein T484DRAFT_1917069 [Cryptophyta sp. CCMP2293]
MATPDERQVLSSQAKLDELFLHWLSLPDSQQYVMTLLSNARKGRPILDVATQGAAMLDSRSPPGLRPGVASPPPRSPTGRPAKTPDAMANSKDAMWLDSSRQEGATSPSTGAPFGAGGREFFGAVSPIKDISNPKP